MAFLKSSLLDHDSPLTKNY